MLNHSEIAKEQSRLLLDLMPFVFSEKNLAMHGGTALNYFILNMPRLSVDIDLTYIPVKEGRTLAEKNIKESLLRISNNIKSSFPNLHINESLDRLKLYVKKGEIQVIIEVNKTMRGLIDKSLELSLCEKAQEVFKKKVIARIVPVEQVCGGKFSQH